jgi:anti-anti-sigma factor
MVIPNENDSVWGDTETAITVSTAPGGAAIVRINTGVDHRLIGILREALTAATRHSNRVVIDLAAVTILDRAGLALLAWTREQVRRQDGGVALVAPPAPVLTALRTGRLPRSLPAFPDTATALAWLDSPANNPPPIACSPRSRAELAATVRDTTG